MSDFSVKCPKCGSAKVFRLSIDYDLCYGAGQYVPVNDKSEYTDEEWRMSAEDRPDIDLFHCRSCDHLWESY